MSIPSCKHSQTMVRCLQLGIIYKTTIYDVKTKAKIHEFQHDLAVLSVAFSNDGSMLATVDNANKTTIYDVKTKAKIHEFKHDGVVFSVAFSNDVIDACNCDSIKNNDI